MFRRACPIGFSPARTDHNLTLPPPSSDDFRTHQSCACCVRADQGQRARGGTDFTPRFYAAESAEARQMPLVHSSGVPGSVPTRAVEVGAVAHQFVLSSSIRRPKYLHLPNPEPRALNPAYRVDSAVSRYYDSRITAISKNPGQSAKLVLR